MFHVSLHDVVSYLFVSVISLHLVLEDTSNEQQFYSNLREQCLLQDSQINEILDSYIRMVGSFPNSTLKHKLGVEVLNGKINLMILDIDAADTRDSQKYQRNLIARHLNAKLS